MDGYIVFKIEYNKHHLNRIQSAFKRVKETVKSERKKMPRLCALDFRDLLSRNIMTQKFAGSYAPYNPRYKLWKEQNSGYGAGGGFWILSGKIVSSLTVYNDKGDTRWFSGLPKKMPVDRPSWLKAGKTGKTVDINLVAHVNEFGGQYGSYYHPPRPVFIPTKNEYAKSGFLKRGKDSLKIIGRSWR